MNKSNNIWIAFLTICAGACGAVFAQQDTFTPYKAGKVPQNVTDLWKDYDARKENLNVKIVKERKAEGVITRYITFKVGAFKGVDSRIAAFYSYPDNSSLNLFD